MKINWKARFRNKTFIISFVALVIGFVYQVLGLFGVVPSISEESLVNVLTMAVNILAFVGVVVDPTTKGFSDSERALTYGTSEDVRVLESKMNENESYEKEPEHYSIDAHFDEE